MKNVGGKGFQISWFFFRDFFHHRMNRSIENFAYSPEPRKNTRPYFPLYWLFNREYPYNWVVFHPLYTLNNQVCVFFFHCSPRDLSQLESQDGINPDSLLFIMSTKLDANPNVTGKNPKHFLVGG